MSDIDATPIYAFRHPRPDGAAGRCIGRTDLSVCRRRAKRLARRAQKLQRRLSLPRIVVTSPLRRCADVGAWLRRWGWTHQIESSLAEMDFGRWDGLRWEQIAHAEVDAWANDFVDTAPGGGESLRQMLERAGLWQPRAPTLVIGHGGWMLARRWLDAHAGPPQGLCHWTAEAPAYGALWQLASACRPLTDVDGASNQFATD